MRHRTYPSLSLMLTPRGGMIRGQRIHLTGSAAKDCDHVLLRGAHSFVRYLVKEMVGLGGGLVVGAGAEPLGESCEPCIFDWTVLEVVAETSEPELAWQASRPYRFAAVTSQRGLEKVPEGRSDLWKVCRGRPDFFLDVTPPGWRMAGIIREHQLHRGDILVALGGGAGAEHLAEMYRDEGKPVVPIYAELGALQDDGIGGSRFLHEQALATPESFFRLQDGAGSPSARLSALRLEQDTDPSDLAKTVAGMLVDLQPPSTFYVRLLATEHSDFRDVESFFREVVDTVVAERGFTPSEMGRKTPRRAFMNVEIFEALHRAGLVVVDLTGVRPNCMMELGYALARRRAIVISAKRGTKLPFDTDKLPTFFWDDELSLRARVRSYGEWFDRNRDIPPLVE